MKPYLIVGGGISGLIAAHLLKKANQEFIGIEKSDSFGGRATIGHHRLYSEAAVQFLRSDFGDIDWTLIDEAAKTRRRGEWVEVEDDWSAEENFYLRAPFYSPSQVSTHLIDVLVKEVGSYFQLRKSVTAVNPDKKTVSCVDGSEIEYSKLIWCTSLEALNKLWQGDRLPLFKLLKKQDPPRGGIQLDLELSKEIFPNKNTVVFPFRFKDHKLRALGMAGVGNQAGSAKFLYQWLVFLDEEIYEDREEVAKCLRTLRRELEKEFPEIKESAVGERIVYLPAISGETPLPTKTLNILPDVIYVGPELRVEESEETSTNLDRALANAKEFVNLLNLAET